MRTSKIVLLIFGGLLVGGPLRAQDTQTKIADLIQQLQGGNNAAKLAAAVALADYGAAAAPAVPALVSALQTKDENLRLNAAIALGKVGTQAVEPVAKVLQSDNASD